MYEDGMMYTGQQGDITTEEWERLREKYNKAIQQVNEEIEKEGYKYSMGFWDKGTNK